ncbi:hypothetical protein BGZ81_004198, partial [Podila clonocystis]
AALSRESALVIYHRPYSCLSLELRLKNIELKKRDWGLVLGGIRYSILKKLSLCGSNMLSPKKHKTILGRKFK